MHLLTIALAEDRAAELAQEHRRRWSDPPPPRARRGLVAETRRVLARGLVTVSLTSAAAVRRLDACIADDLVRPMAPADGA